ncbi:OLC1v1012079C2 [Oldenlandia corymbosa var. corymbosa]|uniref:non-specific serine/threonine protein kinase n=1 Tax=Oldenlandia corymbosa var. corymbosa TaxID=529605 RepID=A0AAV1DXC2_OLDCO|nr:OLC1v1012079C2 [Oldenlandia corymbosa var. corymbosa]
MADKTIFIDLELNYIELVDKVCRAAGFDKGIVTVRYVLVWTDSSARWGYMHIHDDEGIPLIYLVSQNWPKLYVCFAPIDGVDSYGQASGAGTRGAGTNTDSQNEDSVDERGEEEVMEQAGSDDEHVPSGESSDEEDGNDTSASVNSRWKAYEAYVDISGWDNPPMENDTYAEKMWDCVIDHIKAGVHFLCKDDAQDAVTKWSTDRGRTFITVKSDGSRWCVKCATSSPKYPQERLGGIPCNWWVRVTKQDDTYLWKVVIWSDSHTCLGENNKKDSQNMTSTLVARLVAPSVRLEPTYKVKLVQENIFDAYHVNDKNRIAHESMVKWEKAMVVNCSSSLTNFNNISTDQDALLAFKNQITYDPYHILARNWSLGTSSSVCDWIGVTCGSRRHRRVTALNISNMGLSGTIPPHLGNLSFLVSLDISGNDFHGELPEELSHLQRLKVLFFRNNNYYGEIPSWIGSLHQLQFLSLRNNSFVGNIPTSISNLTNLQHLWLSFTSVQGSIPKSFGNLQNLKELVMVSNEISGPIPHEIFNISSLEFIALSNNSLSGSLPSSICNHLKKLVWLDLSTNKLNGQIPSGVSQCAELDLLSLSFNHFDGFIPKEIGSLKALEGLDLSNNDLEGEIPKEMGNLTMLVQLSLSETNLAGTIPKELGRLQHLELLELLGNNLNGTVPFEIFNISSISWILLAENSLSGNLPSNMCDKLPYLEDLLLGVNHLGGALPKSISNCSSFKWIDFDSNNFVGSIPNSIRNLRLLETLSLDYNFFTSDSPNSELGFITSLTNCKFLTQLYLDENPLSGYLPESIGNLSTSLEEFSAPDCKIEGKIPKAFGNLSSLIFLSLENNQLVGSIPETFKGLQQLQVVTIHNNELDEGVHVMCGLQKLDTLDLSRNQIFEPTLECLGNITSLRHLLLNSNRFASTVPASLFNLKDLLELNLSKNLLSGPLSPEVGNLKVVTQLDFSFNNLSSDIPSTIGNLQNLENFSLAFNQFHGSIPESMGKMVSVKRLDLSHNDLSGIIPMALETLQYLYYFNVSYNRLSGEIPSRGPFQNLTSESFISNKALCGASRFHVPSCPKSRPSKWRNIRSHMVLYIMLGLASTAGTITLAFVCIKCLRREKGLVPTMMDAQLVVGHERFTYYQLANATDRFHESNVLGKGSFGTVYRGILEGGRIVAIKVFNSGVQGAFQSFSKECEILCNIRHRNLTRVISNCSMPDFKALVLEYMHNGSLEKWLHSNNYFLNIMQRLDIMIDVATALEYLHNDHSTSMVHCDLKPSNILLDEDIVAHISDFGIAKFLREEDSFIYTNTIATFGYVAPGKKYEL